jgi:hypothetical protein
MGLSLVQQKHLGTDPDYPVADDDKSKAGWSVTPAVFVVLTGDPVTGTERANDSRVALAIDDQTGGPDVLGDHS